MIVWRAKFSAGPHDVRHAWADDRDGGKCLCGALESVDAGVSRLDGERCPECVGLSREVPTLGRIVHYRLLDRWIVGIVVDDEGATLNRIQELELHGITRWNETRAWWMQLHDKAFREVIFGSGFGEDRTRAGMTVVHVKRGEEPGQWRWPPREL